MSEAAKPVSVTILEKEYLIACTEEERELLNDAANLLNDKMQEVRCIVKKFALMNLSARLIN